MPTYVYTCEKCDHQFEVFQSMTEPTLTTCPKDKCSRKPWGKGRVKRLIGAGAGFIFKGSGFYVTDYRSDSYRAAAQKDSQTKSGSSTNNKSAEKSGSSSTSAGAGTSGSTTKKEST
jgi:putative FmdB family regulatory protein